MDMVFSNVDKSGSEFSLKSCVGSLDIVGKMFVGPASFAVPAWPSILPADRLVDRWVSTFRETDKVASD